MSKTHQYKAKLIWTGVERGLAESYEAYSREYLIDIDGKPFLRGSAAPIFRGDPTVHNPADLFLAAISSCHMLCYLALAARVDLLVLNYEDETTGTMILENGKGQFTEVVLNPIVIVSEDSNLSLAKALHDQAHERCFIACSVNFPVKYNVVIKQQVIEPSVFSP